MPTPLFDAHNHLQDDWLAPHRDAVFRDLAALPVHTAVVNGTCESDWPAVAALTRGHDFVLPSYGLHPWHVGNASPAWRGRLLHFLDSHTPDSPVPGIGEIGLDRWIIDRARPDDPRLSGLRRAPLDEQLRAFTWQLALAAERNLPVTIHCLDAWGPLLEAIRASAVPARGFLLHAYGGSAELAREFTALGAYFSFNGYFLGERQAAKREVFKAVPLDRLLVETDAPAMPLPAARATHVLPNLADGTTLNHPANLRAVYAGLAELRGLQLEVLAAAVEKNFARLFGSVSPASSA